MKSNNFPVSDIEWNNDQLTLLSLGQAYSDAVNFRFLCEASKGSNKQKAYQDLKNELERICGYLCTMERIKDERPKKLREIVRASPTTYHPDAFKLLVSSVLWVIEDIYRSYHIMSRESSTLPTEKSMSAGQR